jgi:hypothetical protein
MSRSHQLRTGLIYYAPDFCHRGYTLFCGGMPAQAYLIDMRGHICRVWSHELGIQYANLLPNGHLLCRATSLPEVQGVRGLNGQSPCVFELDLEGRVVWEYRDDWLHHDHHRLGNGNTLLLAWRRVPKDITARVEGGVATPDDPEEMLGDVILEVDSRGEVVREWRSWEHLDPVADAICPIDHRLEWTHANSINVTPEGHWLVSLRRINTVAAIDPESGGFVWKWGAGVIAHQHDAQILPNGHLMLFDNGVHRYGEAEFSRVLEVDLDSDEVVWRYQSNPPFHFYSFMAGSAERQPNGNTLICDAAVGRYFEVRPNGEIVWEYVNPFFVHNPRLGGDINITFKVHRYGAAHPALTSFDLDPAQHAELNRLYAD